MVVHGDGEGSALGYPTANFDISKEELGLVSGVYAARVTYLNGVYKAALVVLDAPWKVEAHLLDYTGGDLYGAELFVEPLEKVSDIIKHSTITELKQKIADDVEKVKDVLK